VAHETPGPGEAAHKSRKRPTFEPAATGFSDARITIASGHRLVRLLPPGKIARKARARLRHLRRIPSAPDMSAAPDSAIPASFTRRAQVRLLRSWGYSLRHSKRLVGTPRSTYNRRRRRHGMRRR
jgi:hypothetical protein